MNKIYKIGNKKLEKINLIYGDKGEVMVGVSGAINSVANTVNLLLEALSDKEECLYCERNIFKVCPNHEPKQEESKFLHNDDKCGDGWHTIGCEHEKTESKQEECGACGYEEKHDRKITPSRHTCRPKQSTSLKEEIYQILDNHFGGFETFNNNIPTEQIISLLQSYLLKEIEDKDFAAVNRHCFDGRVVDLEDIIKIINNISK